jgi:hypothetical protein
MRQRKRQNVTPSPGSGKRLLNDFSQISQQEKIARDYAGRYVALKDQRVVAFSKSSAQVFRTLRRRNVRGAVIHFLPELRRPS